VSRECERIGEGAAVGSARERRHVPPEEKMRHRGIADDDRGPYVRLVCAVLFHEVVHKATDPGHDRSTKGVAVPGDRA
jgi:hypothetical protein